MGATRGGKGLWSRDQRCSVGAVLNAQAIGDASVVRWLQRVVQGRVRGDGLVFRGALGGLRWQQQGREVRVAAWASAAAALDLLP